MWVFNFKLLVSLWIWTLNNQFFFLARTFVRQYVGVFKQTYFMLKWSVTSEFIWFFSPNPASVPLELFSGILVWKIRQFQSQSTVHCVIRLTDQTKFGNLKSFLVPSRQYTKTDQNDLTLITNTRIPEVENLIYNSSLV